MSTRLVGVVVAAIFATTSLGAAAGTAHAGPERCPGNCHKPTQPVADRDYVISVPPLDPHGCRHDYNLRQSICPGFEP